MGDIIVVVVVVGAEVVVVLGAAVVVVVVGAPVVVVVELGHETPGGMHTSVTVSTSVRASTLADRTAARTVHLPGRFPLDRVCTVTPVNAPQTESVPIESTRSCPTLQWPVARKVDLVKLAGVHPSCGWFRQSCRLKLQSWSVVV
jgi:hypothetical protein